MSEQDKPIRKVWKMLKKAWKTTYTKFSTNILADMKWTDESYTKSTGANKYGVWTVTTSTSSNTTEQSTPASNAFTSSGWTNVSGKNSSRWVYLYFPEIMQLNPTNISYDTAASGANGYFITNVIDGLNAETNAWERVYNSSGSRNTSNWVTGNFSITKNKYYKALRFSEPQHSTSYSRTVKIRNIKINAGTMKLY